MNHLEWLLDQYELKERLHKIKPKRKKKNKELLDGKTNKS